MTHFGSSPRRNIVLLVALLLLLAIEPFFLESKFRHEIFSVMFATVMVSSVWAVSRRRLVLVASLLVMVPLIILRWAFFTVEDLRFMIPWTILVAAFLTFVAGGILWRALTAATVTADAIAGALCTYLLLGVVWALVFSVVELAHPGSFLVNGHPVGTSAVERQGLTRELLYLSLVTLSTVGYGDVLPVTPPARMLAALEAVIGQLYLAVLIARLVGLHVPRSGRGA